MQKNLYLSVFLHIMPDLNMNFQELISGKKGKDKLSTIHKDKDQHQTLFQTKTEKKMSKGLIQ